MSKFLTQSHIRIGKLVIPTINTKSNLRENIKFIVKIRQSTIVRLEFAIDFRKTNSILVRETPLDEVCLISNTRFQVGICRALFAKELFKTHLKCVSSRVPQDQP